MLYRAKLLLELDLVQVAREVLPPAEFIPIHAEAVKRHRTSKGLAAAEEADDEED